MTASLSCVDECGSEEGSEFVSQSERMLGEKRGRERAVSESVNV